MAPCCVTCHADFVQVHLLSEHSSSSSTIILSILTVFLLLFLRISSFLKLSPCFLSEYFCLFLHYLLFCLHLSWHLQQPLEKMPILPNRQWAPRQRVHISCPLTFISYTIPGPSWIFNVGCWIGLIRVLLTSSVVHLCLKPSPRDFLLCHNIKRGHF